MSLGDHKEKEELDKLIVSNEAKSSSVNGEDSTFAELESFSDELVGQTVGGHYEIVSKIGTGGMSTVYKARHLLLNKYVAIKFILTKYVHDERTARRFKQEAMAASELKHPNICGVSEFGLLDDGRAFIVMEYIEGESMAQMLQREGKLSPDRVVSILIQVAEGLGYAVSKGVIHRDIKPENIMVTAGGDGRDKVSIVDFGIAKLVRDDESGTNLTQTGDVFGTPNYMSPEQCYGNKIDYKTDIYSLGCVLHEAVSGTAPFAGQSSLETIMKQVNESPPPLNLDKQFKSLELVSLKCLEKKAENRYDSVELLKQDLLSISKNESPVNAKTGRTKAGVLSKLNRNVILPAIAVFVVICGALFVQGNMIRYKHEKSWKAEDALVEKALKDNDLVTAEVHLERALAYAKSSRNQSLITLSLKQLSDVETKLGKDDEASEHSVTAKSNVLIQSLQSFFLGISGLLITVGVFIFIAFLWLFGPGANNTLVRSLIKKNDTKSKNSENRKDN